MSVLRWLRIFIPVLLVAVLVAGTALVLTSRSDLHNSRDRVDQAWASLHTDLVSRYLSLNSAKEAVRSVPGPLHRIVTEVDDDLNHWDDLKLHGGSVAAQVEAANELEAAGRRLVLAVHQAPRLQHNQAALSKVDAFAELRIPASAATFDEAVAKFEKLRGRPSYTLAARILGYGAIPDYDTSSASDTAQ